MERYAVVNFKTEQRVSPWVSLPTADRLYAEQGDPNTFGVRSRQDPRWANAPYAPPKLDHVRLDRVERSQLLDIGRKAGGLEAAKDAMFDELLADPRFEEIDVVEVSDYAWAAAKFCFPREYTQEWR